MYAAAKPVGKPGALTDPVLWNRIRIAPLPTTRDGGEFARALANARDIPLSEARDVEQEYRRFLYLAALSDAPQVAPPQVRQAWLLHASSPEYTAFCAGVLKKPLPVDHTSRMLGATSAYQRTRTDYQREFGNRPPRLYWPEDISPRMPRWLGVHAAILGFTGSVAWGQREPLILAAGLGMALALYAVDLWSSRVNARRRGLGDSMSDDLTFWLSDNPGE